MMTKIARLWAKIMALWGQIISGVKWHAEWLLIPLFIGAVFAAVLGVYRATGRWPLDDMGELVSAALRGMRAVLVVALAGATQGQLCGWRGQTETGVWMQDFWNHVLDTLCTLILLVFFAALLWH